MKTLEQLAEDAKATVESGFYDKKESIDVHTSPGLVETISKKRGHAIICEVKFASPSAGEIRGGGKPTDIAKEMEAGGAVGFSVLTEPKNFNGSITNLMAVRQLTRLPIIMKDIVVSKEQITAAKRIGASAVLFIEEIFSEGLSQEGLSLVTAVELAKQNGLDTIVESHTREGIVRALKSGCDVVGINNRDLHTFETKIETTIDLMREISKGTNRLVMSESGYEKPQDIVNLNAKLRSRGLKVPDAFLIGTAIMRSNNIQDTVKGFVEALK